jgi:hypothetical protein
MNSDNNLRNDFTVSCTAFSEYEVYLQILDQTHYSLLLNHLNLCKVLGFHYGEYEDGCVLGCFAM